MIKARLQNQAEGIVDGAVFAVAVSESMGHLLLELRDVRATEPWRVLLTFSALADTREVRDRVTSAVALRTRQNVSPVSLMA